jgi:glutamate dehydrogenase
MADDVARLVLRDNYLQGEALSVAEARGPGALDRQTRLIRELEKAGRLDRALEFLPDDETLAARAAARHGLVRPELAVLLAYAKMALDQELVASDLPDAPELAGDLIDYFPPQLRQRFAAEIGAHPLRREIVATVVTNDLVNRAGLTFVTDLRAATGAAPPDVTRSYRIVRAVFGLPELWAAIEALDGTVPVLVQTEMLLDIAGLVEHAAAWLLRRGRLDIGGDVARLRPSAETLTQALPPLLPATERAILDQRIARLAAAGVPQSLAERVGSVPFLTSALEVSDLAEHAQQPLTQAARIYYGVGARFALDEMRAAARRLPAETAWQKQAVETVIDDVYALQSDLAARVLETSNGARGNGADPVAAWAAARAATLAPVEALAADLRTAAAPDLAMLVVASRQLRQALG